MDFGIAQISGTPTTPGTYPFTVQMQTKLGTPIHVNCSITVAGGTPVSLTCGTCGTGGTVGTPYSCQLSASGGTSPYSFAIIGGALPPGLSLNTSTGVISGTPLSGGTFTYTAQVTDAAAGTAQVTCSTTIAAPVSLACGTCGNPATVGVAYSCALVVTGGVPPYTFSLVGGSLPPGTTLDPTYGVVYGTPTTAGSYSFTVRVTDSLGSTADVTCGITVAPPGCTDPMAGEGLEEIQPSILPTG
jgi:hypothetical protein